MSYLKFLRTLLISFFLVGNLLCSFIYSQTYYSQGGQSFFYEVTLPSDCEPDGCTYTQIGPIIDFDYSFCPNGNLYGLGTVYHDIYQIDLLTGDTTLIFDNPSGVDLKGLVCANDSIFYSLSWPDFELYVININAGTVSLIGPTNYDFGIHDIAVFEGAYYFAFVEGLVHLDVIDPSNSSVIINWPYNDYQFTGLTASSVCHTLIGKDNNSDQLIAINLVDGSLTPICSLPAPLGNIVSYNEYLTPTCEVYLDLDCNDSSGATEADFNSPDFDCLSGLVPIADEDIKILIDDVITTMTIELIDPLPDD